MSSIAFDKNSVLVLTDNISDEAWERIKNTYQVGDYVMTCCRGIAIPKTSQYGTKFFAHYTGECDTSPESKWHKETKALALNALQKLSILAKEEVSGGTAGLKWKADIYFELDNRKIAIEIQHSYQSFNTYKQRQERYLLNGVEAFWLLYPDKYKTMVKSIAIYQVKNKFGGKFPKNIRLGCMSDLPLMFYTIEPKKVVAGISCPGYSLKEWFQSIIDKRFIFRDEVWAIS